MLIDVSESLARFLGVPKEQLLGRYAEEFVAPSTRGKVARLIQDRALGAYEADVFIASGDRARDDRARRVDIERLCSGDLGAAEERGIDPNAVQGMLQKPFDKSELLAVRRRN